MIMQVRLIMLAFVVGVLAMGVSTAKAVTYSDGPFVVDLNSGPLWDINSGVTFSATSLSVDPVGYDAFGSISSPDLTNETLTMAFSTTSPLAFYNNFTWSEEIEYDVQGNGFVAGLTAVAVLASIEEDGQLVAGFNPTPLPLFTFETTSGSGSTTLSETIDFADLGFENVTGFTLQLNNMLYAAADNDQAQGSAFISKNSGGAEIDSEVIPEPATAVMGLLVLSAASVSALRRRRA